MPDGKNDAPRETEVAVHWREEDYYHPTPEFVHQANLVDTQIRERFSEDRFPEFFREHAELLSWDRYWDRILDTSNPPFWRWFVGGKLNASKNALDRHLPALANKVAFYFVPEPEEEPVLALTYRELYVRVNEMAAVLKRLGVKKGDRITIHLPMVPELPVAMLAAARIGAIHSVVFAGFSGRATADRIADSGSRLLVTMDAYWRGGKLLDHKQKADEAVALAAEMGQKVERVLVFRRYPGAYRSEAPMVEGRDVFADALLAEVRGAEVEPEVMEATDPLFIMYTSGTTGKPKGHVHSTGGYLAWVAWTAKHVLDLQPEDVYWGLADIGWITGHSYIVYGPLLLGVSGVIYEGAITHPDPDRVWRVAERLGVSVLYTSPTAIRLLRKANPEGPKAYRTRFKLIGTVGEPIEPDVWRWYYHRVGKEAAAVVDTWWQTETGGFLLTTLPATDPMKPGSAGPALPGIYPVIYDEMGREIPPGAGRAGNLCIQNPWPGQSMGIWGDPDRFVQTYYLRYNKNPKSTDWRDWPYFTGDAATQAADGYYRILGRVDDVINVAGHRLGTKELESAVLKVPEVAEAAVVGAPDELKGQMPVVFASLHPGKEAEEEAVRARIAAAIEENIGKIARPKAVHIVPDLPKTRSGKIMRRILVAIASGRDPGDVTTLANPEIVEAIRSLS